MRYYYSPGRAPAYSPFLFDKTTGKLFVLRDYCLKDGLAVSPGLTLETYAVEEHSVSLYSKSTYCGTVCVNPVYSVPEAEFHKILAEWLALLL